MCENGCAASLGNILTSPSTSGTAPYGVTVLPEPVIVFRRPVCSPGPALAGAEGMISALMARAPSIPMPADKSEALMLPATKKPLVANQPAAAPYESTVTAIRAMIPIAILVSLPPCGITATSTVVPALGFT